MFHHLKRPYQNYSLGFLLASFFMIQTAGATNGIQLISSSAVGLGRAGAVSAVSSSLQDELLFNPSLILGDASTLEKESAAKWRLEGSFTELLLNVKTKNAYSVPFGGSNQYHDSQVKGVPIPSFAGGYQLSNDMAVGFGVVALAGLSSDQKNQTDLLELKPELTLINVPLSFAIQKEGYQFGVAPLLAVARYSTNYSETIGTSSQSNRSLKTSLGTGIGVGVSKRFDSIAVGLSYKSKSRFHLKEFADFDSFGPISKVGLDDLSLESPEQLQAGVAYRGLENWTFFLDLKEIAWKRARGFKDFGWKNQSVLALAVEHQLNEKWTLRSGFNLSSAVYDSVTGTTNEGSVDLQGHSVYKANLDLFNVVGYPAILTKTISIGSSMLLASDRLTSFDFAAAYSLPETIQRSGIWAGGLSYQYETKISFLSLVASIRTRF